MKREISYTLKVLVSKRSRCSFARRFGACARAWFRISPGRFGRALTKQSPAYMRVLVAERRTQMIWWCILIWRHESQRMTSHVRVYVCLESTISFNVVEISWIFLAYLFSIVLFERLRWVNEPSPFLRLFRQIELLVQTMRLFVGGDYRREHKVKHRIRTLDLSDEPQRTAHTHTFILLFFYKI